MSSTEQELKEFDEFLEILRKAKRAGQGLPLKEQDSMRMLVNEEDTRERARLHEPIMWTHDAMEILAGMHPRTFGFLKSWAEVENIYTIPLDGEQRKEFILGLRAKTEQALPTTALNIQMPQTKPEEPAKPVPEKKKGGIFHR